MEITPEKARSLFARGLDREIQDAENLLETARAEEAIQRVGLQVWTDLEANERLSATNAALEKIAATIQKTERELALLRRARGLVASLR